MRNFKTMNRRRFLRGLGGVSVGLPLLQSLSTPRALAQASQTRRFVVFFTCNGVNTSRFYPTTGFGPLTAGSLTGTALEPLTGHVDRLLLPRGIHQVPLGYGAAGNGCDHAKGCGTKLTAQDLEATAEAYAQGISVDQVIAQELNPQGRDALTLFVGRHGEGVLNHIAYRAARQPVTGENNPWLAYRDFMGLGQASADPASDEATARIALRKQSVLDLVQEEFDDLKSAGLGQADRDKLDLHFTSIRELETAMTGGGSASCSLPQATETELLAIDPETVADEVNYKQMGTLLLDVMALALACDHTRVATIQWGTGAGGPIFTWDGLSHEVNHHKLSHGAFFDDCFPGDTRPECQDEPVGWETSLFEIDRWHAGRYLYLLDKLAAYQDPSGSVLDNSLVLWANELANGRDHSWYDLPFVIAGSAGGFLKQGQQIDLAGGADPTIFWEPLPAPHHRLLITCMQAMGMTSTSFGDPNFAPGDGAFSELLT